MSLTKSTRYQTSYMQLIVMEILSYFLVGSIGNKYQAIFGKRDKSICQSIKFYTETTVTPIFSKWLFNDY